MKFSRFFSASVLAVAFAGFVNASALYQNFIVVNVPGPDFENAYTLQGFQTPKLPPNALVNNYEVFDIPEIDTYDPFLQYGVQIKFAADLKLSNEAKQVLKRLFGQDIPDGQTFQIIVQKSSSLQAERFDPGNSNGGIAQNQLEPISIKAQYPYVKYAMPNWYGTTVDGVPNVIGYCVDGRVTVDAALLENDSSLIYPTRNVGVSIHSINEQSMLSPDILHLYRGNVPQGLDTCDDTRNFHYSDEAYANLIKGENRTKALLYKIQYDGWQRRVFFANAPEKVAPLPKEADRWGIILVLDDEDYDGFVSVLKEQDSTLGEALCRIPLVVNATINGVQIIDLFR